MCFSSVSPRMCCLLASCVPIFSFASFSSARVAASSAAADTHEGLVQMDSTRLEGDGERGAAAWLAREVPRRDAAGSVESALSAERVERTLEESAADGMPAAEEHSSA